MIRVDILIFYTRNRTFASPVPYFFHKKNWLIGQFFLCGTALLSATAPFFFYCLLRDIRIGELFPIQNTIH